MAEKKPLLPSSGGVLNAQNDVDDEIHRSSKMFVEFNPHGLTSHEAKKRLEQYGPNSVEEKQTPLWVKFLQKFWGPMPILIEIAIILSGINAIFSPQHDWISFSVLIALLLINGLIGFFEERNAGKAIEALKKSLAPKCAVRRDGTWQSLDAKELVPGDLIAIKLGDIVPADCKVCEGSLPIEVDESALTGESLPVTVEPGEHCKSGGIVKKGEVEAFVTATGKNTYIGEAMALVAQTDVTAGRFQTVIFKVAKTIIIIALCAVVVIFCLKVIKDGENALMVINLCLVLMVASIPIAMQVVCTSVMAVGSRKLASHNVIVSRLGAIEELAGMTILCTDKTGTLTLNKLEMRQPWTLNNISAQEITFCAALAAKRVNPDAIDLCIVNGIPDKEKLDEYEELNFIPFDPISKRTEATLRDRKGGTVFKVSKGAPQVILGLVRNRDEIEEEVERVIKEYAERGLRTLGVARAKLNNNGGVSDDDEDEDWEFMGILSFHDPPRHDTKQTIETAISMGADVKMITGDHLLIGKETARLLGMGQAFYGKGFLEAVDAGRTNIDGVDVSDIVEAADGFAQVAPKHKYFIVNELQKRGHITAMTGDGVNDAPALKKADIGIAVDGATEAAKAAADIVLLTPGLSVIITAMIRSRKIFQRMKNYCIYRIICTYQFLTFFTIAIIGLNFSIPTITLVFITLLNDGTILTIAHDNVIPSKKPEAWKLHVIAGVAIVVGSIATLGLFALYYLYTYTPSHSAHNVFGFKFDPNCYYSKGPFPGTDLDHRQSTVQCSPLCPGYDADSKDKGCGDYVGWSEAITVVYMCLNVGGQLTVFIARTKHSFWSRRPGYTLWVASGFAQVAATFLSVYWPAYLGIDAYVGVPVKGKGGNHAVQVVMNGIGWKMAGFVWIYCVILFILEDLIKVYVYYAVDNDSTPDVDIQKIKKEKRPYLPKSTSTASLRRKERREKKKKQQQQKNNQKKKGKESGGKPDQVILDL